MRRWIVYIMTVLACSSSQVYAGGYLQSAHGDATYGVERTGIPAAYTTGNCVHCHEQHTSIDGEEPVPVSGAPSASLLLADGFNTGRTDNLYIQSDNVCFQCHASTGSLQTGGINNYDYSKTFGGAAVTVTSIMDALKQASYHNLYDIQRYITGAKGSRTFVDFPAGTNPCSGCHNVHLAKANWRTPGDPTNTVMSRPSDHNSLWGDDTSERMTAWDAGDIYQPPLYGSSTTMLEPDGASSDRATQALKTPDYSTFCIDCHNATNTIYSTALGRNLKTFDWNLEVHGAVSAVNWANATEMKQPFEDSSLGSYVLSCLDCHEPHGSTNTFLICNAVNTKEVDFSVGTRIWDNLCSACHLAASDLKRFHHQAQKEANYTCDYCHIGTPKDKNMRSCVNCHFHGSSDDSFKLF